MLWIITQNKLGKQIKIDFEIDILSPKVDFPENSFDYAHKTRGPYSI